MDVVSASVFVVKVELVVVESVVKLVDITASFVVIVDVVLGLVVVSSWQLTFLFSFPFLHLTVA